MMTPALAQLGGESGATKGPVNIEDGGLIDAQPIKEEQETNLGIFPRDNPNSKGNASGQFMSLQAAGDSVKTPPPAWDYYRHVNMAADHLRLASFHLRQAGHNNLAAALEQRLAAGDLDAKPTLKNTSTNAPAAPKKGITAEEAEKEIEAIFDPKKK
ncbi:hypothetical protein [Calycomorphotria hydatis]|nr:hypothetical protein [Calycomorphotria hydatis]